MSLSPKTRPEIEIEKRPKNRLKFLESGGQVKWEKDEHLVQNSKQK